MSMAALFRRLGAPLNNVRWSWGSVRPSDGAIVLRVWQDPVKHIDGRPFMRLTENEYFKAHDPRNAGYLERLEHVRLIDGNATTYMIMCVALDMNAIPRVIREFNKRELFCGGLYVETGGDSWLELGKRISIDEAIPR